MSGTARPPAQIFIAAERLLDCVHCGLCQQACPTYLELGTEMDSPRGRIYLMRALSDGTLALTPEVVRHLDLCLGCRACETACPSGVHYGRMIEGARALVAEQYRRRGRERWQRRWLEWVFPYPRRLRALMAPVRLAQRLGVWPLVTKLLPVAAMIPPADGAAPLPQLVPAEGRERRRVGLLAGCVARVWFAQTNEASARVLTRNGCSVVVPRAQTCCGALSLHNGSRDAGLEFARRTIDAFPADLDAIIANAAGCGALLREYGELLADDPAYAERAREFSAKVRDISEWLVALGADAPPAVTPLRVAYHDACHLAHGQQVCEQPRALLRLIPGVDLVELPEADLCCGSAGSYNLLEPAMAARLQARKVRNIESTHAQCVAAANPGCMIQIQAGLRRRKLNIPVVHPVDLLDRAYRGLPLLG
ncbi:MAG: glycolate oxidase subunit GlcF [Deltaproteobacteria bacterium]|nr:glycolate oxidase subunit GlcF [Deltaproteobacteria bacterium]